MSLKFVSIYPNATIYVSILFYTKKCADLGEFVKQGWWAVNDGETTEPYAGNLSDQNRYFYFYAEATDGQTWSGNYFYQVSQEFNQCLLDNTNCNRRVGYIELDIGSSGSQTVVLSANGWEFENTGSGERSGGWDSDDDDDDDDDGWGGDDDDD
jgi:uncharacterized membrane protein